MVQFNDRLVPGEGRRGAGKIESGPLANLAATTVASHEIGATNARRAVRTTDIDPDALAVLAEADDLVAALQIDVELTSAVNEHALQRLLPHAAQPPLRLALAGLVDQEQPGKMAADLP